MQRAHTNRHNQNISEWFKYWIRWTRKAFRIDCHCTLNCAVVKVFPVNILEVGCIDKVSVMQRQDSGVNLRAIRWNNICVEIQFINVIWANVGIWVETRSFRNIFRKKLAFFSVISTRITIHDDRSLCIKNTSNPKFCWFSNKKWWDSSS